MRLKTKFFQEVEITEQQIISFAQPLAGFEEYQEFALLDFEKQSDTMLCLQSLTNPGLAFVLFNPFSFMPQYQPTIQQEDLSAIDAKKEDRLLVYVLAVIKPKGEITVNMKNPIVINPENHKAVQTIIDHDTYSLRHPLRISQEGCFIC